jgi:hypothetical protein
MKIINFIMSMTTHQTNTFLNTASGSILAVTVISTHEMASALIVGFLGAVGAFLGSIFLNWIKKKITGK